MPKRTRIKKLTKREEAGRRPLTDEELEAIRAEWRGQKRTKGK